MQSSHQSLFLLSGTTAVAALTKDNRTTFCFIISASFLSLFFILSLPATSHPPPSAPATDPFLFPATHHRQPIFLNPNHSDSTPTPPSLAYFISGSAGDFHKILRLLYATYHPRNHYLLHLDLTAPQSDRDRLALFVQWVPIFRAARNVNVMGKADFAHRKGSSSISSTLHGASILLRLSSSWDWFINLSASDYPLVTQDDLLHILSFVPRDLNFVNHSSYIGWRESRKLKPIIVDPGLYLTQKTEIFYVTQKRELPNSFQLFTGSSSAILNRAFIEFCIVGTDNLPRTVLMYLANTPSSLPNYFPTILCNSRQFNKTIVNHNLLYASFDKPAKEEPRRLGSKDYDDMIRSGAAFASQFRSNDAVLDRIDQEVLGRSPGKVVPGGWCLGEAGNDTCAIWGDANVLRPGRGAKRLEKHMVELLSDGKFPAHQCIVE